MDRLILVLILVASCRTTKPATPAVEPEAQSATLPAQEEPPTASEEDNLPEPTARDLNRLYTWLATQETGFELDRLEDCEAQLLVRADRVQNKADIQKAADELQADVRDALPLYHWCYFHMLSRLEYQLEQQNLGRSYQDKLQQFLRESKALFIVAECLDRTRKTRRYRTNLQKKYITLSQSWFGRSLSPTEEGSRPETKKPAAPYQEK
ncbi:MAG TPA: hypothetical protein VE954_25870 [Oligoflexus sp.]|uniref:hypothetical protein n=1 Tax=Oligoflexus sp. TaxID=1971216 RepID=UPI002D3BE9A5|nr:hypothetical protein [Oligoflexus sp.]HYX36551.1 hypothetical protein [Oligoflexus sp.]